MIIRTAGERDGRTANDNPTALATSMPRPTRAVTIHGLPVNANHVDQIAIGFITGAAHSSAVAYGSGSRLRTRFANVGTTMQSHTGRHSPPIIAIASPPASDFGTCRSNASALTNVLTAADIILAKELLFDKYTLKDEYPYQDTVRSFKWDAIRKCLAFIENLQYDANRWAIFQNYKNVNREAPLVRKYTQNVYRRIADTLGVERYQSVPLYLPSDTLVPERYGRDGALVSFLGETGSFYRVSPVSIEGEWWVPRRYVKLLSDSTTRIPLNETFVEDAPKTFEEWCQIHGEPEYLYEKVLLVFESPLF